MRRPPTVAELVMSVALAPDAHPLTLGIGSVLVEADGSNASFDAVAYFSNVKPLQSGGQNVRVVPIDFPTDTDYALSGKIEGPISYSGGQCPHRGRQYGIVLGAVGIALVATGVTSAVLVNAREASIETILIIDGAAVALAILSPFVALAVRPNARDCNRISSDLTANLKLRRHGKVVATWTIPLGARNQGVAPYSRAGMREVRNMLLAPIFRELGQKLAVQLASTDAVRSEPAIPPAAPNPAIIPVPIVPASDVAPSTPTSPPEPAPLVPAVDIAPAEPAPPTLASMLGTVRVGQRLRMKKKDGSLIEGPVISVDAEHILVQGKRHNLEVAIDEVVEVHILMED